MKKKLLFLPLCFVPYFLVLSGCNHINKLFNLNTSFYCDYYSLFSTSENGEYYNGDNYIEGSGQYANIAFVKLIGGSGSLTLDIEVKQQIQYSTTLTINLGWKSGHSKDECNSNKGTLIINITYYKNLSVKDKIVEAQTGWQVSGPLNIEGGIYPYVISGGWGKRLIKIDDTNYFTLDLEQQNSYPYTPDGGGGAYNISPSDFPYEWNNDFTITDSIGNFGTFKLIIKITSHI